MYDITTQYEAMHELMQTRADMRTATRASRDGEPRFVKKILVQRVRELGRELDKARTEMREAKWV
jgi:hypothetical protein